VKKVNIVEYYVLMNENVKMRHYSRNGGWWKIKQNDGGGEFNYDILKERFVNVTMYPQDNNNI
jgi:hypothetical protein